MRPMYYRSSERARALGHAQGGMWFLLKTKKASVEHRDAGSSPR